MIEPDEQKSTSNIDVSLLDSGGVRSSAVAVMPRVRASGFTFKRWHLWLGLLLALLLLLNSIGLVYVLVSSKRQAVVVMPKGNDSTTKGTLSIDESNNSVGVHSSKPDGLQVGASIKTSARGEANVRLGVLADSPTIVFENSKGKQWQLSLAESGLQYGEVGQSPVVTTSSLDSKVTTTLGTGTNSALVVQGANISAPNNLSINSGTLYVDAARSQVAIGTEDSHGYKLYVAGNVRTSSTITAGDQILSISGTAAKPGITFQGASSSGLYATSNSVSVTADGKETLRVSSGTVSVLGNLQLDGYIRTGTSASNPSWQLKRLSGTITDPDMYIPHGVAASNRILIVDAYYLDGAGKAQSIFDYFDNSIIHLVNGIAGRPYSITIIYSATGEGW